MIADNVGDNVGDCAGMAADLFETYAVTAVAVMLLGTRSRPAASPLFPLALGGVSIVASVIGIWFARVGRGGSIMNALYKAVDRRHGAVGDRLHPGDAGLRRGPVLFGELYVSALVGLGHHLRARRDHRVLHRHALGPRQVDLEASQTGHATNIIEGLAVGMQATALPVIVIAIGIVAAYEFAAASTASASRSWRSSR